MQANTISPKQNQGFSLIELLVSLVIASIIFGGVVQVALSGKKSAMDGEEVSFIQDNARFVLDQIKRDARAAGFKGCASLANANSLNAVVNDVGGFISLQLGIEGFEGDVGTYPSEYDADVSAGTDSFIVRFADASREFNVRSHDAGGAEFTLWSNETIDLGTTVLVTDSTCRSVGLFQVTGPGSTSDKLNHASDGTRNCTSVVKANSTPLDCGVCSGASCGAYSAQQMLSGANIMPYKAHAYYIGQSDVVPGMPALKRRTLTASGGVADTVTEEIALGVENLQITYGEDSDDDGVANRFVDADDISDWAEVVSFRMFAVFRSSSEVFSTDQSVTIDLDGSSYTLTDDKYLRQVVSTTVRFRNL